MSAYYAAPGSGPHEVTGQEQLAPVLVAFAGPAAQSRLTVLIRLLMVIPHVIVLWALTIAAYVLAIIGWFGALFTGRLPAFAADYLAGYLRWQVRVAGYAILLTDVYPPFTLDDADYPIRVAVRPGRLNRLAVLFRFFLLIPAWIVTSVVGYGAFTLVQFVSWLIVLITGRMPGALHEALAAVLRYQARVLGFTFMLTSAYPRGLYGEAGTPPAAAPQPGYGAQPGDGDPQAWTAPAPAPGEPQGEAVQQPWFGPPPADGSQAGYEPPGYGQAGSGQPGYAQPGYAQPGYAQPGYAQPGYAQPGYAQPGYEAAAGAAGAGVLSWWLVLPAAAKNLITAFIVLGVLFAAGQGVLQATVTGHAVTQVEARSQLQAALTPLNNGLQTSSTQLQACNTVACASPINRSAASSFNAFAGKVRAIRMPSGQDSADAANLASAASHIATIYTTLAGATSTSQYETIATGLQPALATVNSDYATLAKDLGGS